MGLHIIHINSIKLPETSDFAKAFNECSELYIRATEEGISDVEREEASEQWFQRRQCLELGIY